MSFVKESQFSDKVYKLFSRELVNPYGSLGTPSGRSYVFRLIPQICLPSSVSLIQQGSHREIEKSHEVLLGFFQACYCKRLNDHSKETLEKAAQAFNEILLKGRGVESPSQYVKEQLTQTLNQALNLSWNFDDEGEEFIESDHASRFKADYHYANTQLQLYFSDYAISSIELKKCAYYLALLNLSLLYDAAKDDETHFTTACALKDHPDRHLIDTVLTDLHASSNPRDSLFALLQGLKVLELKLSKMMMKEDKGSPKREVLAVVLKQLFWDQLPMAQIADCAEWVDTLIKDAECEEHLSEALDKTAGILLSAHLRQECDPKRFKSSLFEQMREVCDLSNQEIIEYLGELFALERSQVEQVLKMEEDLRKNQSNEERERILSAFIFYQAGVVYLMEQIPAILLSKQRNGDLKSFYSTELKWLPRDLYHEAHARFSLVIDSKPLEGSPPSVNTYLENIKGQLKLFNASQVYEQLTLSPFELYRLATTRFNEILFAYQLIKDPLLFPPTCPTSDAEVLKILQRVLAGEGEDYLLRVLAEMQKPDEIFLLNCHFEELLEKQKENKKENQEIKTLEDLFDPSGKGSAQQPTEKQVEIDLSQEFVCHVQKVDLVGELGGDSSEQACGVVEGIKEGYNEAAFEKLLYRLKQDPTIKHTIWKRFEENWVSGDSSLFGTEVQEGGLLTEQKREQILKEARYLSTQAELNAGIESFKRRLNQDLSLGKFAPIKQKMLQTRYADFFGLIRRKTKDLDPKEREQWQRGYKKIVRDALLIQEIRKLESAGTKTPGTYIENTLLNLLKLGDPDDLQVRQERHEAEVQVLKTLLEGEGLIGNELESLRQKIAAAKLEGRLRAAGVPQEHVDSFIAIVQIMENIYETLLQESADSKKEFNALSESHPMLSRKMLIERKAALIDIYIKQAIDDSLKKIALEETWKLGLSSKELIVWLCKHVEPFHLKMRIGDLSWRVEKLLEPEIEFQEKWKERLAGEMIQGVADKNEAFEKGVCAGVGTRWGVNDQRFPEATVVELCAPQYLKISKTDRLFQGFVTAAFKLRRAFSHKKVASSDLLERQFPPALRRALGIESVEMLCTVKGTDADKKHVISVKELEQFQIFVDDNREKLKASHGVFIVRLDFIEGAHRIYLRFDPGHTPPIFRLGEPNAGILELKNEQEFFECFSDLCHKFYESYGVTKITLFQLGVNQ